MSTRFVGALVVLTEGSVAVRFLSLRMLITCALMAITLASVAEARFAKESDLASVNEFERAEIDVDSRGHSKVVIERLIRIKNDEGRERESTQAIEFNDRSARLKILSAQTLNGKRAINVSKKNIEIKPVGDFSRYFDTLKRAKITFPNVQVGSKIRLKYEIDTHEVPNEGFFSFLADFNSWYMEKYEAVIRSALPLNVVKNDPENLFQITPSKQGRFYFLEIHTTKPIMRQTTEEESAFIRADRNPSFVVSSLESWQQYATQTIANQEKLFAKKLPASMMKIRDAALGEKTVIEKLDRVSSLVSQEFRYFGDWRRRNGGFIPRTLAEIHQTRYGDCKDLSLVTAAIYRALGFKADIAWTLRGDPHLQPLKLWYEHPVDWFNHAVTRVEVDGKVYWIDATNPVTYASSVPADISGKPAFVLDAEKPFLDTIPALTSDSYHMGKSFTYEYQPDHSLKTEGELTLKGRAAINLTMNGFYKPLDGVNYDLIRALSYGYKLRRFKVGEYPHGSRIVGDLVVPFEFTLTDIGVRTSAGYGFLLSREGAVDRLIEETRDRASDIYLDPPGVWTNREELVGVRRIGERDLNCDLKSEWVHAKRDVRDTPTGIVTTDRFEIKKSLVPNEILHTAEFERFQSALRECFFRAALVVEPREAKKPAAQGQGT